MGARERLLSPLTSAVGDASVTPLLILFGLNLVDEFDRIAFAALTPEIRDSFGLSDGEVVAIGAISAVFILLSALPIGYMADRFPRVRVAGGAALIWGSMAVVTGTAWIVPVLFTGRLFAGIARTSNEVVHPSLLADYYPPAVHPRVFQIHRLATPLSAIAGLVAGAIGATLGWRWAFILLALPTFVLLTALLRLREPRRGESVFAHVETGPRIPFREARRQLFALRSLRRMWLAGFFLGMALISIAQLLSLFFENVYDYGPFARGVVQFFQGSGIVAGILIGGAAGARMTAKGNTAGLAVIAGLSFVHFAVGLLLMVLSPWAPLSVALTFVFAMGLGVYQPVYFPLVARIAPARIRSQAYAYALLFVGFGAILAIPIARLGENVSYRLALGLLSGIVAIGGLVAISARRLIAADVAAADASLIAGVATPG